MSYTNYDHIRSLLRDKPGIADRINAISEQISEEHSEVNTEELKKQLAQLRTASVKQQCRNCKLYHHDEWMRKGQCMKRAGYFKPTSDVCEHFEEKKEVMNKVSITRLTEYAEAQKQHRPDSVRLQLLNIELSRETAEWLLEDLAKRGKRLQQSVEDPKTRSTKRDKREAELSRLAYAVDAINHALNK